MRTTLTIDDEIAMALKDLAHRSGRPFRQVVVEALRKGLHALENPEPQPDSFESPSGCRVICSLHPLHFDPRPAMFFQARQVAPG